MSWETEEFIRRWATDLSESEVCEYAREPEKIYSREKNIVGVQKIGENSWLVRRKRSLRGTDEFKLIKTEDTQNLVKYDLELGGKVDFGFIVEIGTAERKQKRTTLSIRIDGRSEKGRKAIGLREALYMPISHPMKDWLLGYFAEPLIGTLEKLEKGK